MKHGIRLPVRDSFGVIQRASTECLVSNTGENAADSS